MKDEAKTFGTKEVAKQLKMNPKTVRALLRSMGKGADGERYQWKESDVPKLIAAIRDHAKKEAKK